MRTTLLLSVDMLHRSLPSKKGRSFGTIQGRNKVKFVKLSPRRTHNAIVRQRLFSLLDSLRHQHPGIWICSPPGAGKTTLITTYFASHAPSALWYQIDQADNDPQILFYFLSQMIDDGMAGLPVWSPELAVDIGRFARLFFREFFSRLPAGSVIVFDNIQELDWQRAGEIFEIAFNEIPEGMNIFTLSRSVPPARLSRLILNGQLNTLTWDALKFTDEEARQFTLVDKHPDNETKAWLKKTDGWAVGLQLLRNHEARHSQDNNAPSLQDEHESMFRYFSGEIFERLSSDDQQWLMMLAHLPGVSAEDAEQMTGEAKASGLLRQLSQDRFFVEPTGGSKPLYHFHPFFREFLIAQAHQRFTLAQRNSHFQRAAVILENQGNIDLAVHMLNEAGAFSALASLLLRTAERVQASGRGQAWREWLGWLPPEIVSGNPWLWYWFGNSLNEVDPVSARQALRRAEQAFREIGDVLAQLITMAALIDSYYFGLGDFTELGPWIEKIHHGLAQINIDTLEPDADLRIHSSLTIALMLTTPSSPALPAAANKIVSALVREASPAARLSAGAVLLHCMNWMEVDTTRWVIAELHTIVEDSSISVFVRGWWCMRAVLWHVYLDGDLHAAELINERGLELIKGQPAHNVERLHFHFKYSKALLLVIANQAESALSLITELKPSIAPSKKLEVARFMTLEANYFLLVGDIDKGIRTSLDAITLTNETGLPASASPHFDRFMAACYAQAQNFKLADEWCANAISHSGENLAETIEMRDLIHALSLAGNGAQHAAISLLQSALSSHRQRGHSAFFVRFPQLAASIAALALDLDIEKDHVRGIIKRQRLVAPDRFSANWPWPVAVRTLGSVTLSLNGDLLAFSGKAQQRPLVLLKALLLAPESSQTQQVIADYLWPDVADGRASLNVTIHRLRKLLGNDDALIVTGGKLSINRNIVWSDVDALTHLCDKIQTLPPQNSQSELNQMARTLLSLYRGPFSDGNDESWLLSGRNRWRSRFLDATTTLGMHLEKLDALAMANTLYLRALEVEPLAETMYRNLMRCAHAQNDPSAAFSAYRRCRETLSVILGKRPSAETERLAISIGLIESKA